MESIRSYPEPEPYSLEQALAHSLHLSDGKEVCVTNGATEAIYLIAQTFRGKNSAILMPTFSEYADACRLHHHKIQVIYALDMIPSGTNLIWICNPNNPTGSVLDKDVLKAFIEKHTECCFVIDQSYEFFTLKPLLSAGEAAGYPNVILLHSMTKRFAVPGLRLGFMTANQILLREIRLQRMPWSVNQLAIEAGLFLLENDVPEPLDVATHLSYDAEYNKSDRKIYLDGEAYFEVAKNKDKRFIVCCNDLEIEALGTTFDVKGYGDDLSVTTLLAEGSVRVSNKTNTTLLKPGEKVEYHKNKQTFTKSPISDLREIDFWRNNMLIFNSASLAEIATTLERMYGVKVVFDSEKLKNVPFSGTIRNSSLHNVFYIISLTYPLTYKLEGDTVKIGSSIN